MSGLLGQLSDFCIDINVSGDRFLEEEAFNRVLCRERKRAERSESFLLLAVMDLLAYTKVTEREMVIRILSEHMASGMRETDVCGWRSGGTALGILFNLIAVADVTIALQSLEMKVRARLKRWLPASSYQKIVLIFELFPDTRRHTGQDSGYNLLFYPEVIAKTSAENVANKLKRCMNISASLCVLVLLLPLTTVIALLVRLTSKGPALFRQERLGQYGKPFMFLKFRTMYVNNDDTIHRNFVKSLINAKVEPETVTAKQAGVFKITDDPRVTPLGRFLRKTSLDELPQFINVLKGDMSLVGPRPAIAYEVDSYAAWHRYRVLARKPGITGLWQVVGRSMTTFDEMVRLDLRYIKNGSIWLDVKLLLATPKAVLFGKGAV